MIEIEYESTFRAALLSGYNLFAGAGFSVEAQGAYGYFRTGKALAEKLKERFNLKCGDDLSLSMIYELIKVSSPAELKSFLTSFFRTTEYAKEYKFLRLLPPKAIMTTNIDDLFHRVFAGETQFFLQDLYQRGQNSSDESAITLLQIHGSVKDQSRPYVFGPTEIASAPVKNPDEFHKLKEIIHSRPTVFWGYGFNDTATLQALHTNEGTRRSRIADAWVQVMPGKDQDFLADYYRTFGFRIIRADTAGLLQYLYTFATTLPRSDVKPELTGNVPTLAEETQYPIEDFFLGAAIKWSHILGDSLHETAHIRDVIDKLHSGKSVIIAGIPGAGKTTLLMQIAAFAKLDMPKLFYFSLSNAKAETLANKIKDSRALLIVDNIANDIEVIETLAKCKHLQILGADRDFAITSVRHRIEKAKIDILGVTSQSPQDLASIWETIPASIRKRVQEKPKVRKGFSPSLYEFISANIRTKRLSEIIAQHVNQLIQEDRNLAELLILACYMTYADSTLSSDVALGYFKYDEVSYDDIVGLVDSVGELLRDQSTASDCLDFYEARSRLVAQEVLYHSQRNFVKEVLLKLFRNVSKIRIEQYHVFKRRAFDSKLFSEIFGNPSEGAEFYDSILRNGYDPYIAQQKALYLAACGRVVDAYVEIEQARSSVWGGKNYTIINSYYKILFLRNLELVKDDPNVRFELRKALDGLYNCYSRDQRKGQHAIVYGECALQYARIHGVPDQEIESILLQAKRIIDETIRQERYLDRPPHLKRKLETELTRIGSVSAGL